MYLEFFNKHGWTYCRRKFFSTFCKHRFPGNTLIHSTNEDLLNIKRKGDPEVSLIFFNLLNLFWHTDKNFFFYAEVNFWDFVRNDNSNKGTTARLNETRFGPKKSRPQYISAQKISTLLMKLPDNFQMREHLRPCRFHIMRA